MRNRLSNATNRYQGTIPRVLCVCSAGLLRSPTAAHTLSSPPYNLNTRAVGLNKEFALIPVDNVLLTWADEIVCMTAEHDASIRALLKKYGLDVNKPIICLDIEDNYNYRDPALVELIQQNYTEKSPHARRND